MKKQYYPLILFFVLIQNAFAQSDDTAIRNRMQEWVKTGDTHVEGKILTVDLYAKRSSWGYGQQFYAANVFNPSNYKIRYTGELYAGLICGNEAVSKFDFTLNSNQRLNKAILGTLNMNFDSDVTGLISSADVELCAGEPIMVGGKKYGINRIKQVGYRNVRAYAIINGGEVPIDAGGVLSEKKAPNNPVSAKVEVKTALIPTTLNSPATSGQVISDQNRELQNIKVLNDYSSILQKSPTGSSALQYAQTYQQISSILQRNVEDESRAEAAAVDKLLASITRQRQHLDVVQNALARLDSLSSTAFDKDIFDYVVASSYQQIMLSSEFLYNEKVTVKGWTTHKERVNSPLGDYLSANGYFDEFKWINLNLESYELPELFLIPILKINDGHLRRSKAYEDAFSFLYNRKTFAFSGSHGAEILNMNGGDVWLFKNKKAYAIPYSPDSALHRMKQLIKTPMLNSAYDYYDYLSAAVWSGCLSNALAHNNGDLENTINATVGFYKNINQWSNVYIQQLTDIELHDVDINVRTVTAFLAMSYFKLYQNAGDEKTKRWASTNIYLLSKLAPISTLIKNPESRTQVAARYVALFSAPSWVDPNANADKNELLNITASLKK